MGGVVWNASSRFDQFDVFIFAEFAVKNEGTFECHTVVIPTEWYCTCTVNTFLPYTFSPPFPCETTTQTID